MKFSYLPLLFVLWAPHLNSGAFPPVVIKACVKEINVKAADLAVYYGTDLLEATKPVKCYLTCLFDSMGFTVNGGVNPNVIGLVQANKNSNNKTPAESAAYFAMIDACQNVRAEGECEEGYMLMRCFMDYGKTHFSGLQANTEL